MFDLTLCFVLYYYMNHGWMFVMLYGSLFWLSFWFIGWVLWWLVWSVFWFVGCCLMFVCVFTCWFVDVVFLVYLLADLFVFVELVWKFCFGLVINFGLGGFAFSLLRVWLAFG